MNNKISSMSALMGVAFAASATLAPMASAVDATFAANNMTTGYTLADNSNKSEGEHKCGEAKCGAEHKKADGEHKCGEAKCGADKKSDAEGKCGAEKKADAEGKCGEGKCGADKKAE